MILGVRTDSFTTSLYLLDEHGKILEEDSWESGRQLSTQIHTHIEALLKRRDVDAHILSGIVVYEGPGSFTGLRIGATIANTMAYALKIPVAGAGGDEEWLKKAVHKLSTAQIGEFVMPVYGGEANITKPRK